MKSGCRRWETMADARPREILNRQTIGKVAVRGIWTVRAAVSAILVELFVNVANRG